MVEQTLPGEAQELLAAMPELQRIELLFPDMNGILRGKRIGPQELGQLFRQGIYMPRANSLLDSKGNTIHTVAYGSRDGDPDYIYRPVAGSLVPVPWASVPTAQALVYMTAPDGNHFFADPRHVLQRAAEPLAELGLHPVVAIELEFYLLDDSVPTPTPLRPRIPGTQLHQEGPQYCSLEDLVEIDPFLGELEDVCKAQRLPASTALSEFAPGQFEINLHHVDDPVLACDHAVLLKRVVKNVARRHAFAASFMAKPFEDYAGCGLHVHVSLYDAEGRNVFADTNAGEQMLPISDTLRHAVGGLVATLPESMPIFAPNANSYRRLRPSFYAPLTPNWGINHRALALRIPLSDPDNLRVEHRVSGADANPYLVVAAVLAGLHHGISHHCDPGRMIEMGAKVEPVATLPIRWEAALDAFDTAKVLPRYLGEDYCRVFAICRRTESERFHAEVSDRDFEWYLRSV